MHTVIIEKIIKGGLGLGHLADGKVVMVPRVLPGEEVLFQPRKEKKSFIEADLLEVLLPAKERITPPCPYYDDCGGCDVQHASYETQIRLKQDILKDILFRAHIGEKTEIDALVGEPIVSEEEFGCRQRIRLQVNEVGIVGFFQGQSHELVEIDHCPLAHEKINLVLKGLLEHGAFDHLLERTTSFELLYNPGEQTVVLLINYKRKIKPRDRKLALRICQDITEISGVAYQAKGQAAGPYITKQSGINGTVPADLRLNIPLPESLCARPINLSLEPGGFCQVNLSQNERCIAQILSWAKEYSAQKALDLFCGMGNFSIPLATAVEEVYGFDIQRSSIRSAQRNAESNNLGNCIFAKRIAAQAAAELHRDKQYFDFVLLDPPRAGCKEVIPLLANFKAKAIAYVSCDPATLSRDLIGIKEIGYSMKEIRMVDMFPQTAHLETLVLLEKD